MCCTMDIDKFPGSGVNDINDITIIYVIHIDWFKFLSLKFELAKGVDNLFVFIISYI